MALAMRATSLAASAGLMALLLIAALSVTYTVQRIVLPDPPTETSIAEPPPAPPEPIRTTAPETPPVIPDDALIFDSLPPLIDANVDAQPTHVIFDPGPVTIQNPRWVERPRDLARYYPARAISRAVEGTVLLDCLVSRAGELDCRVISETPANWGFAAAALRIAADHRMAPATRDGVPVEGRYRMRVPFELN